MSYTLDAELVNNANWGGANGRLQFKANAFGGTRHTLHLTCTLAGVCKRLIM